MTNGTHPSGAQPAPRWAHSAPSTYRFFSIDFLVLRRADFSKAVGFDPLAGSGERARTAARATPSIASEVIGPLIGLSDQSETRLLFGIMLYRLRRGGFDVKRGAVNARNLDFAAGRRVGAGDPPYRVIDADRAGAVDDGLSEDENAPDKGLGAAIEEGLIGRHPHLPGELPPDRNGGDREHGEGDELRLPRPVHDERDAADQERGKPEPQHEHAGCQDFHDQQHAADDEPVPPAERSKEGQHGMGPQSVIPKSCRLHRLSPSQVPPCQ
jgi:hypothetical protein